MRGLVVVLICGAAVIMLVAGMVAYLTRLEDTPPVTEQERKGRARYLIDTRLPSVDLKELFFAD